MRPLQITAFLMGRVILPPQGYVHLDALIHYAVCQRDGIPPALDETQIREVEIPIARSECGRYHLASASACEVRERDLRYIHKRPVVEWAQMLGTPSVKRMLTTAGANKAYRIPVEAQFLVDDRIDWWCIGDLAELHDLLRLVTHVGRRRGVGEGEVRVWRVEPCEPWGDGFPILRDGAPTRHLPLDMPGITGAHLPCFGQLTFPYWLRSREEPIAAPMGTR